MTCEVCCIAPAVERCSECDEWLCEACRDGHEHPTEPDHDYAMEQRRDDAREEANGRR